MKCRLFGILSCFIVVLSAPGFVLADAREDNIGHNHHHHRHNSPHKTVTDPMRFHTNREGAKLELPNEGDAFFFVVYGDRTGGPVEGVSVLADAVRDTNLLEPDFVMTVGDLVNGYNDKPKWMEQMEEYKFIMDHLLCPWFPVAGNHDVYWRGEGETPKGENEHLFEKHFGPLWYAFEHKNCWFIALFSDEGNPETGEKNFRKPECNKVSPEQFAWLEETLKKAKDADHVFLFLHHPRWLKGRYGDDWDRIHKLLVEAGNVTAVFAGHIHHLHYDKKDGIEYVTLATVGGGQSSLVPEAGYLHQFHVVTVRPEQIAIACIPVGEVMDPREITGQMQDECVKLVRAKANIQSTIVMQSDGSAEGTFETTIANTASRPIDITLIPDSGDSRWVCIPDHTHLLLPAGKSQTFSFKAHHEPCKINATFRPLELLTEIDYLTEGFRYSLPERRDPVPMDLQMVSLPVPAEEHVINLEDIAGSVPIPSSTIKLPDGPFTLECWFQAKEFGKRAGLVTKAESSDYGIFVSHGTPHFSVFLGEQYEAAKGPAKTLEPGKWYHIAGVFDGQEVRLYLDGKLLSNKQAAGKRKTNNFPLIVGADVNKKGLATSHFNGCIDEVRLSRVARYSGESFEPMRRLESDNDTLLLLHADQQIGDWLIDSSPDPTLPMMKDGASVTPILN